MTEDEHLKLAKKPLLELLEDVEYFKGNADLFTMRLFAKYGKVMKISELIVGRYKELKDISGIYAFYVILDGHDVTRKQEGFLYLGRSKDLRSRYNDHRNQWINNWILGCPYLELYYCYISNSVPEFYFYDDRESELVNILDYRSVPYMDLKCLKNNGLLFIGKSEGEK